MLDEQDNTSESTLDEALDKAQQEETDEEIVNQEEVETSDKTESKTEEELSPEVMDKVMKMKFPVKVDGQEEIVELGEALKGYMRNSHFTKNSQKNAELIRLGEQYQSLSEVLSKRPDLVKVIQSALEEQPSQEQPEEELDYEESLLKKAEQNIVQKYGLDDLRQKQFQNEIENIFTGLKNDYGDGVDEYKDQVLNVFKQRPDLNPQDIFKIIAFDDVLKSAYEQGKQETEQEIEEKKKGRVPTGTSAGSSDEKGNRTAKTLEEAFQMAQQELSKK